MSAHKFCDASNICYIYPLKSYICVSNWLVSKHYVLPPTREFPSLSSLKLHFFFPSLQARIRIIILRSSSITQQLVRINHVYRCFSINKLLYLPKNVWTCDIQITKNVDQTRAADKSWFHVSGRPATHQCVQSIALNAL